MLHLRNIYSLIIIALISSCAMNQDLVNLDEVDDIYYQSSPNLSNVPMTASIENGSPDLMDGASNAERSYYQQTPYSPQTETSENESEYEYNSDEDYYDENYARRLENFHSDEKKPQYNYGDEEIYEIVENTSIPQVTYNLGFGYRNYGYGPSSYMGFGMSYGTMYYGMNYGFGSMYGNYPYYYSPPYYNPYCYGGYGMGYGMGYGNSYWNGYNNGYYSGYYHGYYNGGYYGSNTDQWGRQISNEQRSTSSSSSRINRGGIINPPNSNGGDAPGVAGQTRSKRSDLQHISTSQDLSPSSNRTRSGSGISDGSTRSSISPRNETLIAPQTTTRQSRTTVSPYARSQQTDTRRNSINTRTTNRNSYSPNNRNSNSKYTPQNNNMRRSSPVQSPSRNTSPTYTPSRSTGGGANSPSRPSTPSRSRR